MVRYLLALSILMFSICDCLREKKRQKKRQLERPNSSGQRPPSLLFRGQFVFHIFPFLVKADCTKLSSGHISVTWFQTQGSISLQRVLLLHFHFSVGIFYSYFINFDHTENFMTTRLNVITVNFATPQSEPDTSFTYISSMCGDLEWKWQ